MKKDKTVLKLKAKLKKQKYIIDEFGRGAKSVGQINSAKSVSKKLKKKLTPSEIVVINKLKEVNCPIEVQKVFYINGKYIVVDLYIPLLDTVVEVDGGYHTTKEMSESDKWRDISLRKKKHKVYRITNERAAEISPNMLMLEISRAK